jgi:hypothetical protein
MGLGAFNQKFRRSIFTSGDQFVRTVGHKYEIVLKLAILSLWFCVRKRAKNALCTVPCKSWRILSEVKVFWALQGFFAGKKKTN